MAWFLLLLAIVIVLLAVTNRLERIDRAILRFVSKLRTAWAYAQEDWEDTEVEIREEARRRRADTVPEAAETAGKAPDAEGER